MASDIDAWPGNVTGKTDVVISGRPSPYEEIDRLRAKLDEARSMVERSIIGSRWCDCSEGPDSQWCDGCRPPWLREHSKGADDGN